MKKLLASLVVIIISAAAVFFARNPIAKFVIETEGSKLWGAPIEVSNIYIDVINQTVRLQNLNVANPEDPQSTMAKADDLYIEIIPESLLDQKVEIKNLEVSGLSLLAGYSFNNDLSDQGTSPIALPDFSFPDTDTLITSKKTAINADIDNIKKEIKGIEDEWKIKLDSLPDDDRLDEYKMRIHRLKGRGNLFEKLAAAKDLKKIYREVRQDVKQIKNLQQDFKRDQQRLNKQITAARKLPEKYSKDLVQSLGLNLDQLSNLASRALAGDLKAALRNMLGKLQPGNDSSPAESGMPYEILLHKATISGPLFEQIPGLLVKATLSDISYPLEKANSAASINLEGGIGGNDSLRLVSTIDHRDGIEDSFKIEASALQLRSLTLTEQPEVSINLASALLNVAGTLKLEGEKISGKLEQNFSHSKFLIDLPANASRAAEIIAEVLGTTSDFGLTINFGGTLSDPQLSFQTSNLDKLISKAVVSQISRQVQRLQSDTSYALGKQLNPEIQSLFSQVQGLNGIGAELETQKKIWRNISR